MKNLQDVFASIVVFLVALPLCMGIAVASGVSPLQGIITGIIGGIIVGFLTGAPLQVSGPAAGLTVLVYQMIEQHGLESLGVIVLGAGIIQIVAGKMKLGKWFRAVNPSVIYGMLSGIGVLILLSQSHVLFDGKPFGNPVQNFLHLPKTIQGMNPPALLVALLTIVIMVFWPKIPYRFSKLIPAPLLAVIFSSGLVWLGGFQVKMIELPNDVLGALSLASLTMSDWLEPAILSSILSLAIIASAETLLCASALPKLKKDATVDYDKELFAQGVGNAMCGLMGALPLTGVIVRSTANIQAGGSTKLSPILHGVWLLALVLLAPWLLEWIPMASLAGILVLTGIKLLDPGIVKRLSSYGKSAVSIYLITLVGILFTDLLTGVLLGIAVSLIRIVQTMSGLRIKVVNRSEQVDLILRGSATVLSLPKLAEALEKIPKEKRLVIHLDKMGYLDHACMDLIEIEQTQRSGTKGELILDKEKLKLKFLRSDNRRQHLALVSSS